MSIMELCIDDIALPPDEQDEGIIPFLKKKYNLENPEYRIVRKSLDARNTSNIVFRYRIVVTVDAATGKSLLLQEHTSVCKKEQLKPVNLGPNVKALIVGSGPAGLFCALRIIDGGGQVIVLERGKSIDERMEDIGRFEKAGVFNCESNALFGEGGAGAYSDGKLNTRIHRPEVDYVFRRLVDFGAPSAICYEARPHLGSDVIRTIIRNIREHIIRSGSIIRYKERVADLIIDNDAVMGVKTDTGEELFSPQIMLATGHSARDMYSLLEKKGVAMEKKGFAVGIRVEHPREYINYLLYRNNRYRDILPAAYYSMTFKDKKAGRGVYTFCMCPGGYVINSSSEEQHLCINGMSNSRRDADYSNSAVVVTVNPGDVPAGILGGIDFQRVIERDAFFMAGGNYRVPAQVMSDFMIGKEGRGELHGSYKPGLASADINRCLPSWISNSIKNGLRRFDKILNGFIGDEGLCMGPETRTSSPVRILRRADYESISHRGLYPIGEGAGYAGGIISSAVDGVKGAEAIIGTMEKST